MASNVEQLQAAREELKQLTEAYLAQVDRMLARDPLAHGRVRTLSRALARQHETVDRLAATLADRGL